MKAMKALEVSGASRLLALRGALALALCGSAGGTILSAAVSSADAVVLGNVFGYTDNITGVTFTLNVETVFKGDVGGATAIQVSHPWSHGKVLVSGPLSPASVGLYLHGIWCLQRTGASTWDLIPRGGMGGDPSSLFWMTPVTLPAAYQPPPGASLLDKLMLEAAASVEAVSVSPMDIINVIETYPPAVPPSPAVQTILARFATLSMPGFREVAVAGMLETGAPGAMAQLAQMGSSINPRYAGQIAIALEQSFRDATPSSVTQLDQYAGDGTTSAAMRKAAVRALAAIHTKEALPFLATLLNSSDPWEQGEGVFGLGAFANGCPTQTPGNVVSMDYLKFKNPTQFTSADTMASFSFGGSPAAGDPVLTKQVTFWQSWWSANGAATQNQ